MSNFTLKNISFSYPNTDKLILDSISTDINDGEFVCVLGKSGCGKSTLLKLLAGLIFPTSGEISFEGNIIKGASFDRGVVFQDYGLFPWMTAGKNIMLALKERFKGKNPNELKNIALKSLEQVGLDQKVYNTLPKHLSGGMQQRVAIAQVLSANPKVLLMDEPFGALDAVTRAKLQDLILELWNKNEEKKTVIFITHDVDEAIYLANRIIVLGQSPSKIIYDRMIDVDEKRDGKYDRKDIWTNEKMITLRNELIQIINKDISEKTNI